MRAHHPHNTHARESSLRKLTRINRWLIAASVALTGLFVEAAAHAFPGKSAARSVAAAKHTRAPVPDRHRASHSSTTHTQSLNPPAQPPQGTTESSAPAKRAAPREPAPSEEAARESAPAHESAPAEPAPEPEATHEAAPAPAAEAPPVVAGGS